MSFLETPIKFDAFALGAAGAEAAKDENIGYDRGDWCEYFDSVLSP